jgi:predicted protein tyrosine phosphatase
MADNRPIRLLFVCSQNKLRSPTAEAVFADVEGVEAMSGGTNRDAEEAVTTEMVEWADRIYAMERTHRNKLAKKFRAELRDTPISVLNIPDDYDYMEPALVGLIRFKFPRYFSDG